MTFVLDSSVVCGCLLDSQASDYADAVAERLQADRAIVPSLLHLEYTNVLRTACKRGRLIAQHAQEAIRQLQELPIDTDRDVPDPLSCSPWPCAMTSVRTTQPIWNWRCAGDYPSPPWMPISPMPHAWPA